jgi:uncharacterized membrane protein
VTPRATQLVIEDTTTHNVLSTFIGSFLFSLVGIIVLSTGAYGERGRVVLFAVTILVIVAIVGTLLRWIDHLSHLGRVTQTTQRVEEVAARAMRARRENPYMGGYPLLDATRDVPRTARPIFTSAIGYVQHLDTGALSEIATKGSGRLYILAIPGDFVHPNEPLAFPTASSPRTRTRISAAASPSTTPAPMTRIQGSGPRFSPRSPAAPCLPA